MRRLAIPFVLSAVIAVVAAACAGETEVVEKIVEVPVVEEKIVEVEVEKVVEVETEKIVEVEVEKVIEVETEKILVATPTPDVGTTGPQFGGDLRIVSQGSISTLDPVFSLFYVVNAVASQIYEGLYGWDGNLEAQPRLGESFTTNADGTEYTFKLRSGIEFHNGEAFTSADAIASINRWRDAGTPAAGIVRRFTDDDALQAVDDTTFTWTFDEPLGAVIFILGIPHGLMPMIPESLASTPFTEPTAENVGTGAYRFVEWLQGDKVVLERNDNFAARSEPSTPGAYAGENIAYLDTLTFLEIPDEETKIAGLETGEWDVVDGAAFDFFQRLTDDPEIGVALYKPGNRSNVYLNPQIPPFSYLKGRQALMTGIDVEDFMFALGPNDLWITCPALYWCGTPLETDIGARFDIELADGTTTTIGYDVNNMELAQQLLNESDYAGETAVILNPTDYGTITPLGPVLKSVMEDIGYAVEMPALDWATVTSMFGNTDSYSLATDWYSHWCCGNPIQDHLISGTLDFIIRDEDLINLQLEFVRETDAGKRFEIVEEIQTLRWQKVTSLSLGQFFPIVPHTNDLKGFEVKAIPFYVNTWLER
jgi:peptide/nickel transport system substrate-binding protein